MKSVCGVETIRGVSKITVKIVGDIDLHTTDRVEMWLNGAVDSGLDVVVDLEKVTFIDSAGLRSLVRAYTRAEARGQRLTIGKRAPVAMHLLKITGLDEMF